jgi:tRNA threonylcarbamoyladenosine biosynthesis protein TsaE
VETIYVSSSSNDTFETGRIIGGMLAKGDVAAVCGELGAGKTVLVKGIAKGLGIDEEIVSPTYVFVNEYSGPVNFCHFDMYRIKKAEEVFETGFFDYLTKENICVIEWADRIEEMLPHTRIKIMIDKDMDKGSDYRKIKVITEI